MIDRVTVFWEVNVHGASGNASVWLLPGKGDPNRMLDDETPAVRIVGPVPNAIAQQVMNGLEKGLNACGLSVVREVTADD